MKRREIQRTWTWAGAGLIVCGLSGMMQNSLPAMPGTDLLQAFSTVIYAASILLFAFGFSISASVVGREPVGMIAMVVVAIWPLVDFIISRTLPLEPVAGSSGWSGLEVLSLLIPAAASLVAAVQIGRGRTAPWPWRWAPLWAFAFFALTWAVPQVILVTERPEDIQGFAGLFLMLGGMGSLAGTLGLGILAIVLAARQRPSSIEIYPRA